LPHAEKKSKTVKFSIKNCLKKYKNIVLKFFSVKKYKKIALKNFSVKNTKKRVKQLVLKIQKICVKKFSVKKY